MEGGTEMNKELILHGRKVFGGYAEGEALVTTQTIAGWGGIDPVNGTITERRHELRGQSFKDKVLVFPGMKGSSGTSVVFHSSRLIGSAPKALVFCSMTTKAALSSVLLHLPAVTALDQNPLEVIETGDWVKVDADKGTVAVIKKD
jgi:predicted aconitase with swiveling domain